MAIPISLTTGMAYLRNLFAGGGTATYVPEGVISSNITPVSNGTTVETDLMSYTMSALTLNANGRGVQVTAWGTTAANGNTKTLKFYFGGVVVSQALSGAANNQRWRFDFIILRVTANSQTIYSIEGLTGIADSFYVTTAAADLTTALVIKVTGQSGTASNDVTQTGMLVKMLA